MTLLDEGGGGLVRTLLDEGGGVSEKFNIKISDH